MKTRRKIWQAGLVLVCVLYLYQSSLFAAGQFDFNDGTTQGWTLDQMYITSSQAKFTPVIGYTLVNSNNQLSATTGSLLIGRSDDNDIYLESPDLSANSNWQGITGYSVDVKRSLYSPCWGDFANFFYFQMQIKVIDTADGNKEKIFAEYEGSDFVFHDITNRDQLYQFTWKPSWLTDPRYKVKKIRLRITGPGDVAAECWYRGSWNIDNVKATTGSTTYNTNPGSNVQVNLGNGVTVTFDKVTGAGNTTMTTSGSGTPPPNGFTIVPTGSPLYYSITTTATYTDNIKICIQYNDAGLTAQQEAALKLQVYETPPGQWKNITTSLNTTTNIICGVVPHLSEFAVMFSSGAIWVLTNEPIYGTINCFTACGTTLFAGTEAGGVFRSKNNGVSWKQINAGLTNVRIRSLCVNSTQVFAGTWGGGVFVYTSNDTTWKEVNTGLSDKSVASLYISGSNLLAGTWGGGVFRSTNNGTSWTAINTGITETHIRSLYISGTTFFAGTINGLFRSTNNGSSWTAINTGLTNTAVISLAGIPASAGEKLFAGTDGGGVFISTNNGDGWNAVNNGLTNLHIPFLAVSTTNLFAASWGGGVFLTMDNGATWNAVNDGLTNTYIRSLVVSGADIFAGTTDGGIWWRPLSGMITDVPDIDVNPTFLYFGSANVGSYIDATVVISNAGTANLNVTSTTLIGTNASEFSVQSGGGVFTLAPATSRNLVVRFAPSSSGNKTAALSIVSNDPDENPQLIELTGTASLPDIAANPASWNYSSVTIGTNSDKTIIISNIGTANLNVTSTTLAGTNASEFSIQSGGGVFTLAPAATRNVVVRFAPTSAGSKTASLNIVSNDPDENPFLVALSGQGVAAPVLSVNPQTLDFGTAATTLSFQISNNGSGSLTWNVTESPDKPWITSISPSSGTNNATVTVSVDRAGLSGANDTGTLVVSSNGGNKNVTVNIAKPGTTLPPHWNFISETGNSASVVLPTVANPNIDGEPLQNGDYIGVFTPAGMCCGWNQWLGANISITVWGDDDQTPSVDGFKANEELKYRVFRSTIAKEWDFITVTYSQGTGKYSKDAVMILSKFDVTEQVCQPLEFKKGWNMFSINIAPVDPNISVVMAPIAAKLVIVKNNAGKTYIPAYGINDIGNMKFDNGYQAYVSDVSSLEVCGKPVDPTTPISLPTGWSIISYLPAAPMDITTALASISSKLVIAKNNNGQTYIPAYGINDIGKMMPGQGYQVYLNAAAILTYPALKLAKFSDELTTPITEHFSFLSETGDNATVIVPTDCNPRYSDNNVLKMGDEIGVFTSNNLCCGAIVWVDSNKAITVWGDNSQTSEVDGFTAGDSLRFRVWQKTTNMEYEARVAFEVEQQAAYQTNGISLLTQLVAIIPGTNVQTDNASGIPDEYHLIGCYPNPFNPGTLIRYQLPAYSRVDVSIYNPLGQHVATLVSGQQPAGYYNVMWDAKGFSAGVYFCRMEAGDVANGAGQRFVKVIKLVLVK